MDRLIHSSEERVEGEKITEVQRSEHIYDGENRIKKQSWSVGGNKQRSESYTYKAEDGTLDNMRTASGETISFTYDDLKRLQTTSGVTGQRYTYRDIDSTRTTTQIASIQYTGVTSGLTLSYTYDAGGNISSIKQGDTVIAKYQYDTQNQLIEENLVAQGIRYEYVYDTGYNIRQVKTYRNGSSTPQITNYEYGDSSWLDLMTKYNGNQITYDAVGNPLNYNNGTAWTFTWQDAHDLATARASGKQLSFHYDMDGVRDSKTVNGVKHEYITQGGNVTLERWNDGEEKSLEFIYDNAGAPYSVIYTHGGTTETYYYILNQQGDVIRIVNASGTTKATYEYDSWGNVLTVSNASGCTIGTLNPIRYRGYYYDTELNMYYLENRYYDPVVKRMLSADDESLTTGAMLNNNNLFSYCDNNPVNRADGSGEFWHIVAGAVAGAAIEAISQKIAGEKLDAEAITLAACSGAVSAAFGGIGGKVTSKAARYALDIAISTASDMVSYAFSEEANSASASDVGHQALRSLGSNLLTASISGTSEIVHKAKKAGKIPSLSKTRVVKSAKKGISQVSKHVKISKRVKKKVNPVRQKLTSNPMRFGQFIKDTKNGNLLRYVKYEYKKECASCIMGAWNELTCFGNCTLCNRNICIFHESRK